MSKEERNSYSEFNFETIPHELKTQPNWVCYRMEPRIGQSKPTKIPYNPVASEKAKANEPGTWTDYETCVAAAESTVRRNRIRVCAACRRGLGSLPKR